MLALWPQLLELMTQKKPEISHLIVQMSKLTQNKLSTITHICTTTITNIIYCLWKLISKSKCPQVIILVASCRNDCKNSDPSSASSILVCVVLEEGKVLCLFIIISRPCYQSLDVHTMVIGNIIIALARHHCTALLHCQMPKTQLPTRKTTQV